MSIAMLDDGKIAVEIATREGEQSVLIESYVKLHNDTLKTYRWMIEQTPALNSESWEMTLQSLETITRALDAGFDPYTPPPTWFNGRLTDYRGPIPEAIQEKIEVAIPIFGPSGITIYDPRPDRFQRALDPVVTGDVRLEGQMNQFLVGQWDLDQDLEYLNERSDQKSIREQVFESLRSQSSSTPIDDSTAYIDLDSNTFTSSR